MNFRDRMGEMLERLGIRPVCAMCGNDHISELAVGLTGTVSCRQDIEAIRSACAKRIGWRVIAPNNKVIDQGPGITLRATAGLDGMVKSSLWLLSIILRVRRY